MSFRLAEVNVRLWAYGSTEVKVHSFLSSTLDGCMWLAGEIAPRTVSNLTLLSLT
jgi:hypothetical protein